MIIFKTSRPPNLIGLLITMLLINTILETIDVILIPLIIYQKRNFEKSNGSRNLCGSGGGKVSRSIHWIRNGANKGWEMNLEILRWMSARIRRCRMEVKEDTQCCYASKWTSFWRSNRRSSGRMRDTYSAKRSILSLHCATNTNRHCGLIRPGRKAGQTLNKHLPTINTSKTTWYLF